MREMSEEQVKKIVGVGAVWPQMSLADIAGEVYLEVAAGSTGKPNQAVEVNNWKILGPLLQTTPGISPYWFGKETARRLDDKLDFTEAYEAGLPSIVAQNQLAGAPPVPGGPPEPGSDPNAQGGKGYFVLTGVTLPVGATGTYTPASASDSSTWWYLAGTGTPAAA